MFHILILISYFEYVAYFTYLSSIIYNIDCTHMFVHTGRFLPTGRAVQILTILVKRYFRSNAARCPST